ALVDAGPCALASEFRNSITHDAAARAERAIGPQHGFKMRASCVFVVVDWIAKVVSGAGHVELPFNSEAILHHGSWYVNLLISSNWAIAMTANFNKKSPEIRSAVRDNLAKHNSTSYMNSIFGGVKNGYSEIWQAII